METALVVTVVMVLWLTLAAMAASLYLSVVTLTRIADRALEAVEKLIKALKE